MRLSKKILLAGTAASVLLLSGCVPILVGGTAATSASVITDRRTTGNIVSDEVVEKRVNYDITQAVGSDGMHITVTSYDGKVLLSGEVATQEAKDKAQSVAQQSLDVKSVVNELAVQPVTSVTQRLSDSMLATKVRSNIIATKKISLNQMKVAVDRGIVYLMGIVTKDEAEITKQVASGVSGVSRVVAVFSVESEEMVRQRMRDLESASQTGSERSEISE